MMSIKWPGNRILKKINIFLLVLIVLINGYVILTPFLPQAEYLVETKITQPVSSEFDDIDRSKNQLIIPKLQIQEKILESGGAEVLDEGIWRRPNTSSPDMGSNTVIVGHRFTYKTLDVPFYHLDKLSVDDQVIVVFDGKIYDYKVATSRITNPYDQTVEAETKEPRLTLYTCDPIWTAENRLVYTANLERTVD